MAAAQGSCLHQLARVLHPGLSDGLWASARLPSLPSPGTAVSALAVRPWGTAHMLAQGLEKMSLLWCPHSFPQPPQGKAGQLCMHLRTENGLGAHRGPSWGQGSASGGASGGRERMTLPQNPLAGPRGHSNGVFSSICSFLAAPRRPWKFSRCFCYTSLIALIRNRQRGRGEAGCSPSWTRVTHHSHGDKTGLRMGDDCRHFPG